MFEENHSVGRPLRRRQQAPPILPILNVPVPAAGAEDLSGVGEGGEVFCQALHALSYPTRAATATVPLPNHPDRRGGARAGSH